MICRCALAIGPPPLMVRTRPLAEPMRGSPGLVESGMTVGHESPRTRASTGSRDAGRARARPSRGPSWMPPAVPAVGTAEAGAGSRVRALTGRDSTPAASAGAAQPSAGFGSAPSPSCCGIATGIGNRRWNARGSGRLADPVPWWGHRIWGRESGRRFGLRGRLALPGSRRQVHHLDLSLLQLLPRRLDLLGVASRLGGGLRVRAAKHHPAEEEGGVDRQRDCHALPARLGSKRWRERERPVGRHHRKYNPICDSMLLTKDGRWSSMTTRPSRVRIRCRTRPRRMTATAASPSTSPHQSPARPSRPESRAGDRTGCLRARSR